MSGGETCNSCVYEGVSGIYVKKNALRVERECRKSVSSIVLLAIWTFVLFFLA